MSGVTVVLGVNPIGEAIARRVSAGRHVLLADLRRDDTEAVAKRLSDSGLNVSTAFVDVSSRASVRALVKAATALGDVSGVIHASGGASSLASPATILSVDLYGTALVLEEFGNVIAYGGAGIVIASMAHHRLPPLTPEQDDALANTPADDLLALPMLQPDRVVDSVNALQISKRGSVVRVQAEAPRWGERGARVNTISSGIIAAPAAIDHAGDPRGASQLRMIDGCATRSPRHDKVGALGAFLMGPEGVFISGGDFLMDSGVASAFWFGATSSH